MWKVRWFFFYQKRILKIKECQAISFVAEVVVEKKK